MTPTRYALYYTPPARSALARFGAGILGWDAAAGQRVAHLDVPGLDIEVATRRPRKYGFHATLKPPFRLAEGHSAPDLIAALEAFARTARPVRLDALKLARLGRFLALVPEGDTGALNALAGRIVTELDAFRAPPVQADLDRRRAGACLSPAQEAHLVRWGYPYVLDEFRFHMTLTGPLDDPEAAAEALRPHIAALDLAPFILDSVTLLGEGPDGFFRALVRAPLDPG